MANHIAFTRKFKELLVRETQISVANTLEYSPARISQIARGEKPSREFVERLIEKYELPREEWLGAAGFGPKQDGDDERAAIAERAVEAAISRVSSAHRALNAMNWFLERLREIQAAHPHLYIPIPSFQGGVETLTMQDAEEAIRDVEEGIRDGIFRPRSTS